MMSSVIAAFFHCVSGKNNSLHGQCPEGSESWCRYQRAKAAGSPLKEIEQGLPNKIINQIKPTYLKLCNETLLKKCLHGKTQNCNESYNNILWNIVPKNIFIGLETFRLGALLALILYNSGYAGILSVIRNVNGSLPESVAQELLKFDKQRISTSLRHSLPIAKLSRKKRKAARKTKITLDLLGLYPVSRVRRNRYVLVITDHFSKWAEIIPLKKASARVIADNFFDNYISRFGAPINLISNNGSQFISDIFENLSERLGIRHVKTVVYRPQANRTERVNRDLVQMIANYVNEQHDTWDQFLREFAHAFHTSVNETTGKIPAELFLGRKLITPFQKLVMVSDGTEFAVGDIERLFEEAKRNTETKHEHWKKYYNRRRHDVQIKVNDWVLVATHPLSSATRKVVAKFKPKFEGPYRVLDVKNNNVVIWKAGERVQRRSNDSQDGKKKGSEVKRELEGKGLSFRNYQGEKHTNKTNKRGPLIRSIPSSWSEKDRRIKRGKKEQLPYKRSHESRSGGPERKVQKGSEHRVNKRALLSNDTNNDLPKYRKKSRREETVTPTTSGYNLRPRIGKREESRPTIERKAQQGGPVRSRKGRERNNSPYIEERTRSSNKNARRGDDQQRQDQERRGTWTKKSLSLEVLVGNANYTSHKNQVVCIVSYYSAIKPSNFAIKPNHDRIVKNLEAEQK
ncbi:retrovirus-related Pol polyprotein from transposon 412 [Trichonephila clavipes]|nr:retrovirus-related Pol polyprotein from transposon 412 [Trichonephila clavipes]